MRSILFLDTNTEVGGVVTVLTALLRKLDRKVFKIAVACQRGGRPERALEKIPEQEIVRLSFGTKPASARKPWGPGVISRGTPKSCHRAPSRKTRALFGSTLRLSGMPGSISISTIFPVLQVGVQYSMAPALQNRKPSSPCWVTPR